MSSNVSGIMPTGTFQYIPPVSCSVGDCDYIDMDGFSYASPMNGSMFGMPSIFGGCDATGGVLGNPQSYFDNMKQYQQFYNQYYIDQQKMNRNADLQLGGSMEAVQGAAAVLKDKIMSNEQDQIMPAFKNYINAIKGAYGTADEREVKSRAIALYQQYTGKSLIQDLRENSHCSALQGFLQTVTLGTYYRSSAEDNISKITGQPVSTGEKTEQNLGRLAGVATIGTAAYGGAKLLAGKTNSLLKGTQKIFKGKAGIIGLAAAGIAAAVTFFTGKIST